ncbi:DUF885 domain-containing protein [Alteromonas gilva]|uniref:DUF885 domain-containing protein n=1 Tax=Alteromonas gilva TaxID=2987522 RepID=A0ABT5KZ64_9ALTE|nr:DUF885 domain-containing protein [Alteromonas gilva]MDC8830058.1 DUF885 domain-containing protein [Alteromonas gilva]
MRHRVCYFFSNIKIVWILPCLVLAGLTGCESTPVSNHAAKASEPATSLTKTTENNSARLASIIEQHWQYKLAEDPILAARFGHASYRNRLPGVTASDRARRLRTEEALVAKLDSINTQALSATDKVNHALLRWLLVNSIEANQLNLQRIPFNTFYSFWSRALGASKGLSMRTEADIEAYIARIKDIERYIDENIANMREGIDDGFVHAKVVVEGVAPTVRALVVSDPTQTSLYEPFTKLPSTLSNARHLQLREAGRSAIKAHALPALDRLATFLEGDYLNAATQSLGAQQLPDGEAYYRHAIRQYVTEDRDPARIHQIGLAEVKRLREAMQAQMAAAGFNGSLDEFTAFLRTDPQFYPQSAEALLKEAAFIAKKIEYRLPEFFSTLPRQPYGIVEVPKEIAPNYTTASYNSAPLDGIRGGAYWVNTHNLDQRPLYEMVALTLHEAVPGHHLQNALSLELQNVPDFRRDLYLSAYGEGWGLYAEGLGVEMGVYETPYQHFGRLSYEMWRACRLVIDTGIHSQGWSRARAIDYLAANTALSMANVRAEVDRYISWPGQALSYKMGQLKILELRERAEQALGNQFDIREFHQQLLGNGALPLALLDRQIQAYIDAYR